MDLEAISGAATVALTSALLFIFVAKMWHLLNRSLASSQAFSDSIMREAAQRFRDEFDRLSRNQSMYLGSALVFAMLFVTAYVLEADRLFTGYPHWQLNLLLVAFGAAAMLAAYRIGRTIWQRRQVKLARDANIAIGHHLQRIAVGLGRAYHDVETTEGTIDHIVVAHSGVYAINVIARRPRRHGAVEMNGNEIVFRPSGRGVSIVRAKARIASLEREFRRLLDHRVRVRSVLAMPGWEITGQSSDEHLLVNERSLPMLRGWKDSADYLMNEEVDALHDMLTSRCRLVPGGRKQSEAASRS